jgi:mannose-6-phosphate isomerase-like protein (cupin superfamily)
VVSGGDGAGVAASAARRTGTEQTACRRDRSDFDRYTFWVLNLAGVNEKINLAAKLALLEKPYQPGIVGFVNDYKLQVVKVKGPFVWHKHDDTDDFFLVLSGRLTIHLRDRDIDLEPGEIFVVPRGVEHCPDAEEETQVLLIEPRDTLNTGDAGGEMTAEPRLL